MHTPKAIQELIVALDRSDDRVAVALLDVQGGFIAEQTVSTAPEALEAWWQRLLTQYPQAKISVGFEQPAPNLVAFFAARQPHAIHALNPSATWAHRQSLVVSHARTDQSDARHIALFLLHNRSHLTPWSAPDPQLDQLNRLCTARRKLVNERTGLTNRLQAILKRYYPQALQLMHEHLWRPMNLAFLRRWPSPQRLRKARLATLKTFFHQHGSRSETRWEARSRVVDSLVPLSPHEAPADLLEVSVVVDQIETLNQATDRYDRAIGELFATLPEIHLVTPLPGAGPAYAPRLYASLARFADLCDCANDFAAAVGVAPVTDQSGKVRKVYRRMRCDNHTRQTWVEWARETSKYSVWARAFIDQRKAKGERFQAISRALAYKWTRILWRCWRDRTAYDETKYIEALRLKGSSLIPPTSSATAA